MKSIPAIKVKRVRTRTKAVKPPEGYVFDSLLDGPRTTSEPPYRHMFKIEGESENCACEIRLEGVGVIERLLCDYHMQVLVRLEVEEENADSN